MHTEQHIPSRHVNATKSHLHFGRFVRHGMLCSIFVVFKLFLGVFFFFIKKELLQLQIQTLSKMSVITLLHPHDDLFKE